MGPGLCGLEVTKGLIKVNGAPRLVTVGSTGPYQVGTVRTREEVGLKKLAMPQ